MWKRLLLAVDAFESGQTAVDFAIGLAGAVGADVWVLHLRELSRHGRVLALETPAESRLVVDEAVFALRLAGVGADGRAGSVLTEYVPKRIALEAEVCGCDAVILGSRRLRGFDRLSGRAVRERLVRLCALPVMVAPPPLVDGLHSPAWLKAAQPGGGASGSGSPSRGVP
ncbi:MAG: universal stress protein [Acidimicrobiales bacterium]|jgi:nucleotide-binding universal stress UspA family protein